MKKARILKNESDRIQALHQFQILDTEAEQEFDDIVELASQICETPISLVTFIDKERQWFKANHGLAISETPREVAFCSHAINQPDLMIVTDAIKDERFHDNPLVANEPNIRFYAGMPLVTDDGMAMGTLCVIDRVPRNLTPQQKLTLQVLGKNVVALLKLRATKRELQAILTAIPVLTLRINAKNQLTYCSTNEPHDLLLDNENLFEKKIEEVLHPGLVQLLKVKINETRFSGNLEVFEYSLHLPEGLSWFETRTFKANDDVIAITIDITKNKKIEEEKTRNLQFIKTVTDHAPVMITHWTAELKNTFANEATLKWFDKKKEEMLGISMSELLGEKVFQGVQPYVEDVLKGELQDFDFSSNWKDEGTIFVRSQYLPDVQQGKVVGFFAFVTNITRIKKIEEATRNEKELSDSIIKSLPGIFYLYQADGKLLRWNKNFETILGYNTNEIEQLRVLELFEGDEQEKAKKRIEQLFKENLSGALVSLLTKEKKRIPFYVNSLAIVYEGAPCILEIGIDISKRVKTERALIEAFVELRKTETALSITEAKLNTVFNNTDIAFILLNKNLEIVSFNQMAKLFAQDHLPIELREGEHANNYFSVKRGDLKKALAGETIGHTVNYSKSEYPFWIYERYLPVFDDNKKIIGLIISFSDITILKKAEASIKESEQRLTDILNNMVGGIVKVDRLGNFEFVSDGAKEIFGAALGNSIDSTRSRLVSYNQKGELIPIKDLPLSIAMEKKKTVTDFRMMVKTKDGQEKWMSVNATPVFAKDGVMVGAVSNFVDITESIKAQEELKQTTTRLQLAKEISDIGVWEQDIETDKITWDIRLRQLTGFDLEAEVNMETYFNHIHPDDLASVKKRIERPSSDGKIENFFRFIRPDGAMRYFRTNVIIQRNPNGKPVRSLGVVYDLTDIILREKSLIQANQKIEEMQQVALRAAMNPHFLFNALNSIQFFITHNDRTNAINYLSKFSKLVRGILNSSINKTTKLTLELELLRHYIEIEQIRFSTKFEFEIAVAKNLDIENIEIPSLLIQPYVENAILHGLYNKEVGMGLLKIDLQGKNNNFTISIEDNGIGRKASGKLKERNFPAYQSKGIHITEDRMKRMDNGTLISSEIEDLYEEEKSIGTRVILKIKKL
jgi:PAS domain S-box-containing protein